MKTPFIPPGGFQGFAGQTLATQSMLRKKKKVTRKRRTKKRVTRKKPARARKRPATPVRSRRRTKKPAHMVKGSAAAKRHMAKLRRMRKR